MSYKYFKIISKGAEYYSRQTPEQELVGIAEITTMYEYYNSIEGKSELIQNRLENNDNN